mgnify:CR=1 FL=1
MRELLLGAMLCYVSCPPYIDDVLSQELTQCLLEVVINQILSENAQTTYTPAHLEVIG